VKRYTSSELRSRLAEILDAAERGEAVVVERRGARFRLIADRAHDTRPSRQRPPLFKIIDPAVEAGQWTWDYVPGRGLRFRSRLPRRRPTKKR
jgi:antitoxin (DNA-binding transcriptional repressor) of toxin-antitoxin stability system